MPPRTPKPNNPSLPTPISSVHHADKRVNIPTEELRDFVEDDEKGPKTLLYPRDPSLDPQLVWKGKDEQDRQDLEVPSVPIYIQEKIQPQAIIEDLRSNSRNGSSEGQLPLFSDFDGLDFEQMVDFYQHEQNWSNRMILGDSLLVMASLAEKEGLKGQVQMIYMDPPYGIKFKSNWQVSTRDTDVIEGKASDVTRQPEQIKAFRDTWELGIHSYLTYLRDRVSAALALLSESGSIFVQIGDENVHLVRCVLDEVFGSENSVVTICFKKKAYQDAGELAPVNDYILWYAKNKKSMRYRQLFVENIFEGDVGKYSKFESPTGIVASSLRRTEREIKSMLADGWRLMRDDYPVVSQDPPPAPQPFEFQGRMYEPTPGRHWSQKYPEGMDRLARAGRLRATDNRLYARVYWDDSPTIPLSNFWESMKGAADPIYVVQTTEVAVQRCLLMSTDPGDLVLDPTCGSGTTAFVAEQWARRWITCDTSRVALALARTRLMSGRFPYYLLMDSPEGLRKERELSGGNGTDEATRFNVKKGFVCKRVPNITLHSIASSEEVEQIYARWYQDMEALRSNLNSLIGKSWTEWNVPREPDPSWPPEAKELHTKWWDLYVTRFQAIDQAIRRNPDTELLFDQPYVDDKRVRVTGPFTVESLSPHRVLSQDDEQPASQERAQEESEAEQFVHTIIENMKKAGVQNTYRNERLKFDTLEPFPGVYLNAEGNYTDSVGAEHRVALHIGPKYGTVGPDEIKDAAKEAVRGVHSFDTLIVAGLAFDPAVSEEVKQYGKLTVLPARINPDLAMGDAGQELLKKTGAGNLFMIFGEPDIKIDPQPDGKLVVTIHGLDIYDPTTGQIRSSSTDDIACWFIDTNYNEEAFFVRHAYFTGANDPYEKLKRALRAEVDEAAWASLYSTVSRPFDPPTTKKIAVKVINHYGDEVLKVYVL